MSAFPAGNTNLVHSQCQFRLLEDLDGRRRLRQDGICDVSWSVQVCKDFDLVENCSGNISASNERNHYFRAIGVDHYLWTRSILSLSWKNRTRKHLEEVVGLLLAAGMRLLLKNFHFCFILIDYQGYIISPGKLQVAKTTTKAIELLPYSNWTLQRISFHTLCNLF